MDRFKGKVAVVTGTSAGIGKAIVVKLVQHGMKVVACARNDKKIAEIAAELNKNGPGEMFPFKCDVSVESEVLEMFKFIQQKFDSLHVCVNNAGLAHESSVLEGITEEWKSMFNINVIGMCMCTREAVKLMRASNVDDGHIINMNSVVGHKVGDKPLYAATKHAVTALTEGTRKELHYAKSHIRTTSISPGFVATEFAYRLYKDEPERADKLYSSIECLKAEDVADAVIYALGAPAHVTINEITLRPTEQLA